RRDLIIIIDVATTLARQHIKMGYQAESSYRLEHVVLKHVFVGIVPVVGDFVEVMIPHDVAWVVARRAVLVGGLALLGVNVCLSLVGLSHEAVHFAAVYIGSRVIPAVRATAVYVRRVMVRRYAWSTLWIRETDSLRYAVHAGKGSEILIEAAVLLHDK